MAAELVINDNNYKQFINPVVGGKSRHCTARGVWSAGEAPIVVRSFEALGLPRIPENEWDDYLAQERKDKSSIEEMSRQLGNKPLDQGRTNYCWANGVVQCAQLTRIIQSATVIPLSSASVAARKTSFRNVGGWGDMALEQAHQLGINEESEWPNASIDRRYDTPETRESAKKHRVLELVTFTDWVEVGTALINKIPVAAGYNWWGHLICLIGLREGNHDGRILNSWSEAWGEQGYGWLADRKKIPDGAVGILSMSPI